MPVGIVAQDPLRWWRQGVIVCLSVEGFSTTTSRHNSFHKLSTQFFSQMTAINFFHLAPAIEVLESVTIWGTRLYALGSEIFTVTAILWCLNFLANLTQKVYEFGYAFGKFYRSYLHSHLKSFVVGVIALAIVLGDYFIEGCKVVYKNRHEILENINTIRNAVGYQFAYAN